jgi:hypothetical protein
MTAPVYMGVHGQHPTLPYGRGSDVAGWIGAGRCVSARLADPTRPGQEGVL